MIVITGLHHVFGAIESQLLVDTGRNFLNPLMSVAIIAQGGAVLGYMVRNMKDAKAKELCIPSFVSVLFGITEPALFGVNIRYRYPLAGGCIGGAVGGAIVYITNLAALGFGTTVVPGIALADPAHHGYMNYVIAHVVALGTGFLMTLILGTLLGKKKATVTTTDEVGENIFEKIHVTERKMAETQKNEIAAYADGVLIPIEEVDDDTFAQKVLGDGIAIIPENGNISTKSRIPIVQTMVRMVIIVLPLFAPCRSIWLMGIRSQSLAPAVPRTRRKPSAAMMPQACRNLFRVMLVTSRCIRGRRCDLRSAPIRGRSLHCGRRKPRRRQGSYLHTERR